jgi:CBS domain containing-hemolysin-like protein
VLFEESGHSRMPVYAETLDDPRGMVHIRDVSGTSRAPPRSKKGGAQSGGNAGAPAALDLAGVDLERRSATSNLIRPVLFVPPSMLAPT